MANKNQSIQAIRGMHDILPSQSALWQHAERVIRKVMACYSYQEIRLPIVEKTELFQRSIGEVTDIVEKEMYTFADRNQDSLTLRPEGTAGCLRACLEHGLLHNQQHRLWYYGPMFRHERPQKGRYRQFYQLGVETYGMAGPDIDVEMILISERLWQELGLRNKLRLELNSLGTTEERLAYKEELVAYFRQNIDALDEDSRRRLETNPLRILDSKNPELKSVIANAPALMDALTEESKNHFQGLTSKLDQIGIEYIINPRLVRGLDYYCKTVFEWVTDDLGAQGTLCAGGRYDGLIEQLGGKANHAIGFAMGMERLLLLMAQLDDVPDQHAVDAYLILVGEQAQQQGIVIAEKIRSQIDAIKLQLNCAGGSFKSQFKKADKSGADYALILAEDELANNQISIKPLRSDEEQCSYSLEEAVAFLQAKLNLA